MRGIKDAIFIVCGLAALMALWSIQMTLDAEAMEDQARREARREARR